MESSKIKRQASFKAKFKTNSDECYTPQGVYDIALTLCTPSELRKTDYGQKAPNSREDWIDVQARALFQAVLILKTLIDDGSLGEFFEPTKKSNELGAFDNENCYTCKHLQKFRTHYGCELNNDRKVSTSVVCTDWE